MLASAALHAGWNLAMRRHGDAPAASVLLLALTCFMTVSVWFPGGDDAASLRVAIGWGLLAGVSEGLYFISLGRALQTGPLAPVYAVSRGLPLLVLWPASHALLGEALTWRAGTAVVLLLAGLAALLPTASPAAATPRPGYLWAVATAAFNVTNALIYKAAVVRGAPKLPLFATSLAVATPLALAALATWGANRGERLATRLRQAWVTGHLQIVVGAAACCGSFLLTLEAMRFQGAAWVFTLRNVSIAFAQILGWSVLGEHPSRRALAGVALIFGGALVLGTA
jgi:uncharacterized membrane protein